MEKRLTNDERTALIQSAALNLDRWGSDSMYHKCEEVDFPRYMITGFDIAKKLKTGDILICNKDLFRIDTVEYRNHKGVFDNPEHAIGTRFKAFVSLLGSAMPPKAGEQKEVPLA